VVLKLAFVLLTVITSRVVVTTRAALELVLDLALLMVLVVTLKPVTDSAIDVSGSGTRRSKPTMRSTTGEKFPPTGNDSGRELRLSTSKRDSANRLSCPFELSGSL